MAQHYIYTFYAKLKDYKPRIWRRFEINGEKTIAELCYAIMIMFEMQANHLFQLNANKKENFIYGRLNYHSKSESEEFWNKYMTHEVPEIIHYDLPDERINIQEGEEFVAAYKAILNHVCGRLLPWKGALEYDYGDGWVVDLTIEGREKREESLTNLPRVLDGAGYGIIEDVGGPDGLAKLAKILKKGSGKEYVEYCEWLGSTTLDLGAFDIDDANFRLKRLMRVYRDIYELGAQPSDRMLALFDRKYLGKGPRGY
jgi:hypothetical protein